MARRAHVDAAVSDHPELQSNRGGYYGFGSPGLVTAVHRFPVNTSGVAAEIGFRCARDDH